MKKNTNSEIGEKTLPIRYFFICTVGEVYNTSLQFNSFDIKTTYGHPTIKRIKELSNERYPNLRNINIVSISEMSEEDFHVFVSEQ